jgi:hypothetical protein
LTITVVPGQQSFIVAIAIVRKSVIQFQQAIVNRNLQSSVTTPGTNYLFNERVNDFKAYRFSIAKHNFCPPGNLKDIIETDPCVHACGLNFGFGTFVSIPPSIGKGNLATGYFN